MLRRESSMSQRTFNEINASPTLFDDLEESDVMQVEASPPPKSRRGRKRQSDEECMSEADRVKKEKNRKAAQKCREKKEKEAKDLKQRNEELERENKKLAEEKLKLENRAQEFSRIIEDHISKGCKVPSNVQEMLQTLNSHSNTDECELFRAVGTIESNHTPPPTPDNSSSGKLSPHLPCSYSDIPGFSSAAPTALFSGAPLSEQELTRHRSSSISRSSSSSPAPSPSPSPDQAVSQVIERQKDLSYFLYSRKVPEALAPISPVVRPRDKPKGIPQFSGGAVQTVPIVVSEIEESTENMPRNRGNHFDSHASQVMAAAFQFPDVPAVDEVSVHLTQGEYDEGSQNLPSMGFSYNVEQYSYSEDLQQMETPQEIIEYTSEVQENDQQIFVSEELDNGQGNNDGQPSVNVSACAPALLEMASEMSESLKQQLKMSYTSSSGPSMTETASKHVQARSEVAQKTIAIQSQKIVKQNPQLTESQIPVNGLPSVMDQQLLIKQLLEIVRKQAAVVVDTDVVAQPVKQDQLSKKSLDYEGSKVLEQKLQILARKQTLPNTRQLESDVLATKQIRNAQPAEHILPNHQIPANKHISTLTVSHKISPQNKRTVPQNSRERVILINQSQTAIQTKTSLSQDSFRVSQLSLTNSADEPITQHAQVSKQPPRNSYLHPNVQTSRSQAYDILTSTVPLPQNLVLDSSTVPTLDVDYSSNVQDLPSLNFTELNSEKNLFEKKPSRSSS